jgi:hypothetical protein
LIPAKWLGARLNGNTILQFVDATIATWRGTAVEVQREIRRQFPIHKNGIQILPDPGLEASMSQNFRVRVVKEDRTNLGEFGTEISGEELGAGPERYHSQRVVG